jgi:hypothetical protein
MMAATRASACPSVKPLLCKLLQRCRRYDTASRLIHGFGMQAQQRVEVAILWARIMARMSAAGINDDTVMLAIVDAASELQGHSARPDAENF